MRKSPTGFFTCGHCDAAYDSDAALQEHKNTAHRGRGSVQRPSDLGVAPRANSETQSGKQQKPAAPEGPTPSRSRAARA